MIGRPPSSKWNIDWQLVRVQARSLKNWNEKKTFILNWYRDNPSSQNYSRVMNWVRMTCMGYKISPNDTITELKTIEVQSGLSDTTTMKHVSIEDLQKVLKDLTKRKYNFQFKGQTPQGHIDFVETLMGEINSRKT